MSKACTRSIRRCAGAQQDLEAGGPTGALADRKDRRTILEQGRVRRQIVGKDVDTEAVGAFRVGFAALHHQPIERTAISLDS